MRTILHSQPLLRGLAALTTALGLCGATPLEPPTRRDTPQPMSRAGAQGSVASFSTAPGFRGDHSSRFSRGNELGRSAAPMLGRRVMYYPGSRIIIPAPMPRCTVMPSAAYWEQRDIMGQIKWMSRQGFIPVTPLGDAVESLSDFVQYPSGWRAYGISVPAGGTVQMEVSHEKLGWFRLMLMDRWGRPGPGMLQAAMAHQPVMVTYQNPGKEATAVYVIVDDPGRWSDARDPYALQVRRSWDPAKTDLSKVKMVAGLWGSSPSVSAEWSGPSRTGPAVYPY